MKARSVLQAGWRQFFHSCEEMKAGANLMIPPLRGVSMASSKNLNKVATRENTPLTPLKGGIVKMLLFVVLWVTVSCSTYNPTGTGDILVAPTQITIKLGAGAVELAWQFSGDLTKVKEFRVYRRSASDVAFRRIASVSATTQSYRDSALTIGALYQYQIAAVNNKSNVEGEHSESVTVTPVASVFGVQIAAGAKFTNRRLVSLTFNVPDNTASMMLSNKAAFTGVVKWEPFSNSKTWELTPGDSPKSVFAKFRSGANVESEPVSDDIILDTVAFIQSITHDGVGRALNPGGTLNIRLVTSPRDSLGNATVDLIDKVNDPNGGDTNIRLFESDTIGVYKLAYRIRPDIEFEQAFVYGNFTDAAANPAPQRVSLTSFTVQLPPKAVTLFNPVPDSASTALKLTWTANNEKDFANYQVFRSTTSPVDSTGKSTPLAIINDSDATTYRDAAVTPGTTYFYRVLVFDRSGRFAFSNQVRGKL